MSSPASPLRGDNQRGDPQIRPPQIRPAAPPRRRSGVRTAGRVTAAGVICGSVLTGIIPLPLSGAMAWLIAWAVLVAASAALVEYGRRRWFPRIAAVWRRTGDDAALPDRRQPDDAPDDGEGWWAPAKPRAAVPAGRRSAARTRAALAGRLFAVPKSGAAAPPEFAAAAAAVSEFRSDDGEELQSWLDGLAAGLYAVGEAISDAHDGMVNDTGLDPIPAAAVHDLADQVVEMGGQALAAKEKILGWYESPIEYAESGGRMPKDGRYWESQ